MRTLPAPIRWAGQSLALAASGHDPFAVAPITAPVLASGDVPVVVGWCADDHMVPADQSRRLAFAGRRVLSVARPDGGHLDLVEHADWWRAIHLLLDMLAPHSSTRAAGDA